MRKFFLFLAIFFMSLPAGAEEMQPLKAVSKDQGHIVEDMLAHPLCFFKSYLRTIKNSRGSKVFRNVYFKINDEVRDVLKDGNLSCAYFVSSILKHFDLIKDLRTSVDGLVEELKENGWTEINEPKLGSILVWEKVYFSGSGKWHGHIGFYIGKGWAISNSSKKRYPVKHYWRREPVSGRWRKVKSIFWHPFLDKK